MTFGFATLGFMAAVSAIRVCGFSGFAFAGAICAKAERSAARATIGAITSANRNARKQTRERRSIPLLRRQLLRTPRLLVRLRRQAFGGQSFGQRLMHHRFLRRQLDGAAQLRNRLIDFVLIEKSFAECAMS